MDASIIWARILKRAIASQNKANLNSINQFQKHCLIFYLVIFTLICVPLGYLHAKLQIRLVNLLLVQIRARTSSEILMKLALFKLYLAQDRLSLCCKLYLVVGYDFTLGRCPKAFNLLIFNSVFFESTFILTTVLQSIFIHNYSKATVLNIGQCLTSNDALQ